MQKNALFYQNYHQSSVKLIVCFIQSKPQFWLMKFKMILIYQMR